MGAVDLANRKEVFDVCGFPPQIPGEPAVVVLGAYGDLKRFGSDIDALFRFIISQSAQRSRRFL
jgi:hypothetical protein